MYRFRYLAITTCLCSLLIAFNANNPVAADEANNSMATLRSGNSSELVKRYSDEQVKNMLSQAGYDTVRVIDDGKVRFKSSGQIYVIYIHPDGDMHVYFGSSGLQLSFEDVNEWNRTTRLSRAYLDDESDIALETDLLSNAGINQEMVLQMVKVFVKTSVPRFILFAKTNGHY